jgi:hypothetical protein
MQSRFSCWLVWTVLLIAWSGFPVASALAEDSCRISVTTILAAHDDTTIDPKLETQVGELQSIFNYTAYRLLGGEHLTLETGQSGSVSLPGKHDLSITLRQIHNDRASMDLQMSRQSQSVFQTSIQLLNRGNLFIGGPKYLNGILIFKISSAF